MKGKTCFLLLALVPGLLSAQVDPERLEERLAGATGHERLELLVDLVSAYRREDPARAIDLGQEALRLLEIHPDEPRELDLSQALSRVHRGRREYDTAATYGARAVTLARGHGDPKRLARALESLGELYRSMNDFEQSLSYFLEALPIYETGQSPADLGDLLNAVGTVYRRLGNYSKALEYYFRAHRTHEQAGNRRGLAWAANSIGIVYRELEQPERSLEQYLAALAIFEREGEESAVAALLNNIGSHYRRQGNLQQALDHYHRSLEIKQRLGNRSGIGVQLHNIGYAHQGLGDLDQAMSYYTRALATRRAVDDQKGLANTLQHIATVHHERGEYEQAVEFFEQSLAIATRIQTRDEIHDAYRDLSATYAAMGRFRDALAASREHDRIESEIFNEQSSRVIAEMQTRFEAEQKGKEIELLKQQQTLDAAELGRQQTLRQGLAASLVLLALVIFLIYSRYRLRAHASSEIERQNRALEDSLAELRDSEQRYRRLFDDPSVAKLVVDPAGDAILAANKPAAELLGQAVAELSGPIEPGTRSAWLRAALSRFNERRAAGAPTQHHHMQSFELGDGSERYFEVRTSGLRLASQETALITLQDVSEHRRLEEEALRRQERERYIGELEAKQAEAEARSSETERFAYSVSHDLKTPLVTIRGFLGLVQKDLQQGHWQRLVHDIDRIDAAAQKMEHLLEGLLELSRIGRGKATPAEVSLAELAQEAVAEAAAGIEVIVADDLPPVVADPQKLLEILRQLMGNAAKFMGEQPRPRIEVGFRGQEDIVYYVRDNGIGIAPSYHRRIFGLFEQLDPNAEGTGIGLTLVEQMIEVHRGKIWVESAGEGRGSTFCFTLGMTPQETEAMAAGESPRVEI
ncbi:MAG: tetratricopeptide repeat protein [Acidobacteriota bacterium]